jgi:hypothetical protein
LDLLLACGFLPYRQPQGSCKVRGCLTNLWYAAAKALRFDVTSIRCPDPLFLGSIKGLGVQAKSLRCSCSDYDGLAVSLMWCSQMSRASRSVPMPSNTGARGRPHSCSTALAVTTALLRGAQRTIPQGKRLSRRPLGERCGWFASRTMRPGEPHWEGELLRSGVRLTSHALSRLHGPCVGGFHCCAASTIGSGWPLTMACTALALPGSRWSARGGGVRFWAFSGLRAHSSHQKLTAR